MGGSVRHWPQGHGVQGVLPPHAPGVPCWGAPDRAIGTPRPHAPPRRLGLPSQGRRLPGLSPPGSARGGPPPPSGLRVEESVDAGCPSAFGAVGIPGGLGLPFISSFTHSSIARVQVCGWPRGKEKAAGVLCAAKRRLWLAAARAAFARAARARVCRPASPCFRSASRSCRCAAVCGSLQVWCALMVQCCAKLCKCGLCGAPRACTMAEA